jgi:hypothetical protein
MRKALRVAGNIGLIVGQCVLLFASRDIGLGILILSSIVSLPYFVTHKYWDIVVLIAFSMTVNSLGLFFGMGR